MSEEKEAKAAWEKGAKLDAKSPLGVKTNAELAKLK